MAMREVVCADCGAINQVVAHACWRCLEPLTDRTVGTSEAVDPGPEPSPATA